MKDIEDDIDPETVRQKAIKTICDTNTHTDRIYQLIQKLNSSESNISVSNTQEKVLEKNTIDELLRTDSDHSHINDKLEHYFAHKPQNTKSDYDQSNRKSTIEEFDDEDDDVEVLETTQELINKDFEQIVNNLQEEESKESAGKEAESLFSFMPKDKKQPQTPESPSDGDDEDEGIIVTEVDLNDPDDHSPQHFKVRHDPNLEKIEIASKIFDDLIHELQDSLFPVRQDVLHEESSLHTGSKYEEKAVFHLSKSNKIEAVKEPDAPSPEQGFDQSDPSIDEIEDEIMMNFNIMRNFEMRRSRAEKNHYDSQVFIFYVNEVFDAIKSKAYLFLKAFSKPIQKDYLECITKLHYHGMVEEAPEDDENSLVNELDDQSSILTIDLYLSLEKKREEENERIRKSEIFNLEEIKMPQNLLRGSKGDVDKSHIKNKLSLFAE